MEINQGCHLLMIQNILKQLDNNSQSPKSPVPETESLDGE